MSPKSISQSAPKSAFSSVQIHVMFWAFVVLVLGGFAYAVRDILTPFLIGLVVAYLLDPLCDYLESCGVSRTSATALVVGVFMVVMVLTLSLLLPHVVHQIKLFSAKFPTYVQAVEARLQAEYPEFSGMAVMAEIQSRIAGAGGDALRYASQSLGQIVGKIGVVFEFLSVVFITPVVVFYLLRDWDSIVARVDDVIPRRHQGTVHDLMGQVDCRISGFLRGQSMVCLILGTFYGTALAVQGLEFGFLIGLFTGLLSFIPYVGMLLGMVVAFAVAVAQYGIAPDLAIVGGIFAVGQMLEGNVLTPKLVGGQVGIHSAWIIFALMAGGNLFGFVGLLFAIPLSAVIAVLVTFATQQYKNSHFYE